LGKASITAFGGGIDLKARINSYEPFVSVEAADQY
jgi:hypothetical protein